MPKFGDLQSLQIMWHFFSYSILNNNVLFREHTLA